MGYQQIYRSEALCTDFGFGIKIEVDAPFEWSKDKAHLSKAANQAAEILEQAITREFYRTNKEAQEWANQERTDLMKCFPNELIFVQPIPNGYCHRAWCEHKPWFEVTTRIGIIKIGWRKRVILIDWSKSLVKTSAEVLFAGEDVTKNEFSIHAWGYDKAREYLAKIFAQQER